MIKKALITASVLVFATTVMSFAADTTTVPTKQSKPAIECKKPPKNPEFEKRQAEFEKRIKLTDKQKAQAEQIRQKGHEQMKPIMEKIKEKHQEIDAVKHSKTVAQDQQAKIDDLHKQIRALERAAHELRMQNMKEFESILTKKQLKELKKMKDEGRKKFEKEHKNQGHPPFGPGPKEGDFPPPPPMD